MKRLSMYTVTEQTAALLASTDPDTGEIPAGFDDELMNISEDADVRADQICREIANVTALIAACKEESARLNKRAFTLSEYIKRMKTSLHDYMHMSRRKSMVTATHTISIRKNPPSLYLPDPGAVQGTRFAETVETLKIDKNAIKQALKDGEPLPFAAELRQSEGVQIK